MKAYVVRESHQTPKKGSILRIFYSKEDAVKFSRYILKERGIVTEINTVPEGEEKHV